MSERIVEVNSFMPEEIYERQYEKVVRCRGCVYHNNETGGCMQFDDDGNGKNAKVSLDGFCAWGVRRNK